MTGEMLSNTEKENLKDFGVNISKNLIEVIKREFMVSDQLPGYGDINEDSESYMTFNMKIRLSLSSLYSLYPELSMSEITEYISIIFINSLNKLVYDTEKDHFSTELNTWNIDNVNQMINFVKIHKNSTIICNMADFQEISGHENFKPIDIALSTHSDIPTLTGSIEGVSIYIDNGIENGTFVSVLVPILDYGIIEREDAYLFFESDNDIEIEYSPIDIFYNIEIDHGKFKTFKFKNIE